MSLSELRLLLQQLLVLAAETFGVVSWLVMGGARYGVGGRRSVASVHLGLLHVILINAYVVNHFTCSGHGVTVTVRPLSELWSRPIDWSRRFIHFGGGYFGDRYSIEDRSGYFPAYYVARLLRL